MCGIAGILHYDALDEVDTRSHNLMLKAMSHRGPDGFTSSVQEQDLVFGSVRLSLIDMEGSHQPLTNEDGSLKLYYNGEIYNCQALRVELEEAGHVFQTKGDGEVILHLYEADRVGFVAKLDGMFAFALWDEEKRRLILARDRLGIKPLYYWKEPKQGRLIFASELKVLMQHPEVPMKLNLEGVRHYLESRFVLPPQTIFQDVWKLEPGSLLIAEPSGVEQEFYWSPVDEQDEVLTGGSFGEELVKAVCTTMVSDFPVGTFLSGGLDSSAVAGVMNRQEAPLAFTVGYGDGGLQDERPFAVQVAEHLGLERREILIETEEVEELLHEMIWLLEEPIYSTVTLSTYQVSRLAVLNDRRVVMSGDGSDELLMGYDHMRAAWQVAKDGGDWEAEYLKQIQMLDPVWREDLYGAPLASVDMEENILFDRVPQFLSPAEQMRFFELMYRLPEYHLSRVDRLSMAHGLEVRVPFLRKEVVAAALAIPAEDLLADKQVKAPLHALGKALLPETVVNRPKQKFSSPFEVWLKRMEAKVNALLLESEIPEAVGLRKEGIRKLVQGFSEEPARHAQPLWGVFILCLWFDVVWNRLAEMRERNRHEGELLCKS